MKYSALTFFALLVSCFGLTVKSQAADLVVSNNAIINIFGDSMLVDTVAPSVGYRFPDFLESYFQLNYPGSNIHVFNLGRSGGTMDDMITNNIQKNGLALWGYQFNNYQHIGISLSTDNGGLLSNQMYAAQSKVFQAPGLMSDGTSNLVAHSGWAATHPVQWIGVGYIPTGPDGQLSEQARNNAGTNAGWNLGIRGIDWWYHLAPSWTNDFKNNGGIAVGWQKAGHPGGGGELAMTFAFLQQITTDTNISTAVVDWNSTTPVDTNHCVISSISRNGNVLTFNRLDDRLPFAWDSPNPMNGATNDCGQAFNLDPTYANAFKFTIAVSNLPAGLYSVIIDGTLAGVVPDTVLSSGWNMFTNTSGPYWAQRTEVLGRIRDKEHVNRYTHVPGSAGDGQGMVSYGSYGSMYWTNSANRGDALINVLSSRVANVMSWDAATAAAAMPTNHTFTIMPFAPLASIKASSLTNALDVPVILDGSSSIKATNYYWEQVSGLPQLDMIGEGRSKIMLLSVTNAGTYTFRLTVTDGQNSSSNDVTLTFVQPTGRTIYVDGQLPANCLNNNYSVANRNGGGSDGNAYTSIQQAATATRPGDVVYIRGGLYTNAPSNPNQILMNLTVSGTATAPIRYEAYKGESVVLAGWGFSDADTNADGLADGPAYPAWRQSLVWVPFGVDYIQFKGLELTNSQQNGMMIEGRFCYVEECNSHDNWVDNFGIMRAQAGTNTLVGSVMRWCEASHARHGYGFQFLLESTSTFGYLSDCAFVDCISYRNGYTPDGKEVLPIPGDPAGGGNSDGFNTLKFFADNADAAPAYGARNWGTNIYFVRDITWNNCDDGFDLSIDSSLVEDCRSLFNGPTGMMGYKLFRYVSDMTYRGNIAYGNVMCGYQLRIHTNASLWLYNNSGFENGAQGFFITGVDATSQAYATNNVAAFNVGPNFPYSGQPNNWAMSGDTVLSQFKSDPMIVNTNVTLTSAFLPGWTIRQKRDYMDGQVRQLLAPKVGSPLLNASTFVPGYHCPRPDNDPTFPMLLSAPGRHWKLPAPTMGPLDLQTAGGAKPAPPTNLRSVTNGF